MFVIFSKNLVSKPIAVQKPAEIPIAAVDKPAAEDITKNIEKIDETGGEEIADDLSEISDEADEILNQQELVSLMYLCVFISQINRLLVVARKSDEQMFSVAFLKIKFKFS